MNFRRTRLARLITAAALGLLGLILWRGSTATAASLPGILEPSEGGWAEQLAAREVRRYFYLRTGGLPELRAADKLPDSQGTFIVMGSKDRPLVRRLLANDPGYARVLDSLKPQDHWLITVGSRPRRFLVLTGGDEAAVLFAAYRFAEILGVRFDLSMDVLPDVQVRFAWPTLDEVHRPLFALRGIQPFHDFPEGPDWWNCDDYLAIVAQLPRLRMNFIALHTYPEGGPNAEPTVWIGRREDIRENGQVAFSYPASYQNTLRGNWGYAAKRTGDFVFGADQLFERDDFGPDVMAGAMPEPATPEQCNAVFERTALQLRTVFRDARARGIRTCLGTETPLKVPGAVRERLKEAGRNPDDPAVIQELYAGMFRRIASAHPLDYYWFWTPEGWTWDGTKPEQVARTTNDLLLAVAAHREANPGFQLATCGWVLGPAEDRALFDKLLPKSVALSCINREVGRTPVDRGFLDVQGRGKWAIPWMEDDPALTAPQLWVGRMRRDAADARRYGCDGLMGIHWRTRVLAPAVSALAAAGWNQEGWQPAAAATTPATLDFYLDWARAQFGPEAGPPAAALLAKIDGTLPRPSDWVDGPGGIRPDPKPWDQAQGAYGFVDEFAALRPLVRGPGELERFDWWLGTFRYLRAMGQLNCVWADYNRALERVKGEREVTTRRRLASQAALPPRRMLIALVGQVYQQLLGTVSTPGELGTVANWEQHILPGLLTKPGEELADLLGEPLPADAQPSRTYFGNPRLIVPTLRRDLTQGDPLTLKVILLAGDSPSEAALYWRPMGAGGFNRIPLQHVARGVYSVTLPAAATQADLEYHVRAALPDGRSAQFPVTAPAINQTVVVVPPRA